MLTQSQREVMAAGFPVMVDDQLGHLMVAHSGSITWDQLQAVKNAVWGAEARAIEVYPRSSDLVNAGPFRHLWRLGEGDFCPDLIGHDAGNAYDADNLEHRHLAAWAEADEVMR